jgi:hypothetical protein
MAWNGRNAIASRVAWELAKGPIPSGMSVCHKCDAPACINVDHLFLGTHQENMADRDAKGRVPNGERQCNAKLTDKQASEILTDQRHAGIVAAEYGVSRPTVLNIRAGRAWKHVGASS